MKAKKISALFLTTVCILTLFASCGNENGNTETTQTTSATTEKKLEIFEVVKPKAVNWSVTDEKGLVTTVSANYCETNEVVSEMKISIEIPVSYAEYDTEIASYEKSKAELDNLNDSDIQLEFVEEKNSTKVVMLFKSLNNADREARIACIEGVLDIEADDEDYVFYYSDLDDGLKLRDFKTN